MALLLAPLAAHESERHEYPKQLAVTLQPVPPQLEVCSLDNQKLIALMKLHEGVRFKPYLDTVGKWTIGVGRNLSDNGLSTATVEQMLAEDIATAKSDLDKHYAGWCDLTENRQMVLVSMAFNLGMPRYTRFAKFWTAVKQDEWDEAAYQMMDSRWAKQVGNRAIELADMMRKG